LKSQPCHDIQNTAAMILTDLQDKKYETDPDHALGNLDWNDFPSLQWAEPDSPFAEETRSLMWSFKLK